MNLKAVGPALLVACLCAHNSLAIELTSTNLHQVAHFVQAINRSNGPVRVLAFGDSMSVNWRSVQVNLFSRMEREFGNSGASFHDGWNRMLSQFGNGTTILAHTTNWWTAHWSVPAGGYVNWFNQWSATGSKRCDEVGLFWVSHPGGGDFEFLISTNGGPWTLLKVLNGRSAEPEGHHLAVSVLRGDYRVRVESLAGTNLILSPKYVDGASSGINISFLSRDEANLDQILSVSTNILQPILRALEPHLIIWHMKEVADIGEQGLRNRLLDLEELWTTCATKTDIVYLGTPYDARDRNAEYTPKQNRVVREAALQAGRTYIDCMTPCVSYDQMVANGFLADTVHTSSAGNEFIANIIWNELGLYGLRKDRTIHASVEGEDLVLTWRTYAGVNMTLQTSSDLSTWMDLGAQDNPGEFRAKLNEASSPPARFYRIRMSWDTN